MAEMQDILSKRAPQHTAFSELGISGLSRQGGYVTEEFLTQLQGPRANRVYKEMADNDPTVGALLFAVDMCIRQIPWRIEPEPALVAQEYSGGAVDATTPSGFLQSCLDDLSRSFSDVISEILSMLVYGWSFTEIVYKRRERDNLIGWRKIEIRAQDTLQEWVFDDSGGIQAMIQAAPPKFTSVTIPIARGLLFRTRSHRNSPEGRSLLRNAYRPWYFKKRLEEIESIGIERDLAGLPIAYVDPRILSSTASADEVSLRNEIKRIVVNVRRDAQEGIVFPTAYDNQGHQLYRFELLSSGGQRQFETSAIIDRLDRQIAATAMADFILLGHSSQGSYALVKDRSALFTRALKAWTSSIADVFNRYAIPRLFAANKQAFGDIAVDPSRLPQLRPGEIAPVDLGELSAYVSNLAKAGAAMFPDRTLEDHLRQRAQLPRRSDEPQQQATQEQTQASVAQAPMPPDLPPHEGDDWV